MRSLLHPAPRRSPSWQPRPSGLLPLLLLAIACGEPAESPPALLRLVTLLPAAEVESPLIGLPAAGSTSELGSLALEEHWRESFESPQPRFSLGDGCARESDGGRGFVLSCRNGGRSRAIVPVQPATGYRIRLAGRRGPRSLGYAVTVRELEEDTPLRSFRFPNFSDSWSTHEIWLFSTPGTRALEIGAETERGRRLLLDEVVVERLDLTREQELRLLKTWSSRSASASALGMAKRGRLLPVGDPDDLTSPLRDNYVVRDALLAPTPTDIHFRLRVPRRARLSLSFALAEHSSPAAVVGLRVLASKAGGPPRVLLAETLSLGSGDARRWREREVSLAGLEGDVRLTLESRTASGSERGYPLWGSPEIYVPRRAGEPPNVVLIAVDTLRADRLSCYGHTPGASPAIDALAADGVRFEQAISAANWTAPSFFSLFTGRPAPDLSERLEGAPETALAEHFQGAGYSTAAVLYKPMLYDRGFDRGFDVFWNAPRVSVRAEHNLARARDWLRHNGSRRFFLFLHFNDPHQPFCQPEETVEAGSRRRLEDFGLRLPVLVRSRDAFSLDPREPRRQSSWQPCRDCRDGDTLTPSFKDLARTLYDDAVGYADDNIGRFLAALEEEGLYDEAVVALVSDHGETLWSHGELYAHLGDNLHDELVRVPLILKPPKSRGWPAGRAVAEQVRLFDLMPTLLELAGIEPPSAAAKSFLGALDPRRSRGLRPRPAFSIDQTTSTLSLRHEAWKYIRYYPRSPGGRLRETLYDLSADPGERVDRLAEEPRRVERMRRAMDEQLLAHGSGRLVVVTGDPGLGDRIRLRWDRETRLGLFPPPGLERVAAEEAVWEAAAASRSPLLLASFLTAPDASLEVTVQARDQPEDRRRISPEDMRPYRPGLLSELISRPGIQVRVFAGRPPDSPETGTPEPVDARQLEALKALGYL